MKEPENRITVGFNVNDDYFPLIDMIDQIAIKERKSRSSVVRDIVCQHFGFEPAKPANKYCSMKNLMTEIA
jgi:hypothetical protein